MKRIIRDRRLTAEEAAKYRAIREHVAAELPELIDRHRQRFASLEGVEDVLTQLRAAREAKGLSLDDLSECTGMDPSALAQLECAERPDPTIATLADMPMPWACGWKSLIDAPQ